MRFICKLKLIFAHSKESSLSSAFSICLNLKKKKTNRNESTKAKSWVTVQFLPHSNGIMLHRLPDPPVKTAVSCLISSFMNKTVSMLGWAAWLNPKDCVESERKSPALAKGRGSEELFISLFALNLKIKPESWRNGWVAFRRGRRRRRWVMRFFLMQMLASSD